MRGWSAAAVAVVGEGGCGGGRAREANGVAGEGVGRVGSAHPGGRKATAAADDAGGARTAAAVTGTPRAAGTRG